jgi:hypothetical protein
MQSLVQASFFFKAVIVREQESTFILNIKMVEQLWVGIDFAGSFDDEF